MKKRQRKKNWVKAGRQFVIGAVDGSFCLSNHPEFATKAESREIWSFAPEFNRNDVAYKICPDGEISASWRKDAEKAWTNSELIYP